MHLSAIVAPHCIFCKTACVRANARNSSRLLTSFSPASSSERFAAGRVFSSSMLDCVIHGVYHERFLVDVTRQLWKQTVPRQMSIPPTYVGKPYEQLCGMSMKALLSSGTTDSFHRAHDFAQRRLPRSIPNASRTRPALCPLESTQAAAGEPKRHVVCAGAAERNERGGASRVAASKTLPHAVAVVAVVV